jgi:hypothetical protein
MYVIKGDGEYISEYVLCYVVLRCIVYYVLCGMYHVPCTIDPHLVTMEYSDHEGNNNNCQRISLQHPHSLSIYVVGLLT